MTVDTNNTTARELQSLIEAYIPVPLIPQETLRDATDRLQQAWQRSWSSVFARAEKLLRKEEAADGEDESAPEIEPEEWARQETARVARDYRAEWVAVAILCYLTAIGTEPRGHERGIVESAAEVAGKAETSALLRQADGVLATLAQQPQDTRAEVALRSLQRIAAYSSPVSNAKASLESFVDAALAQVTASFGVQEAYRELHDGMGSQIRRIVRQVNSGELSQEQWRAGMIEIFQDTYREAYRLGKLQNGGAYLLTEADKKHLQSLITDENKFLAGWLKDARTKYLELPDNQRAERMLWRGKLYADALKGVFNEGWKSVMAAQELILWVRSSLESCQTCIAEAAMGWRKVETLTRVPGDGSTICTTNCKCYLARGAERAQQTSSTTEAEA